MDAGIWITVVALACLALSVGIPMLLRKRTMPDFRERKRKGRGHSRE
jgi:hypothetical protein